MIQALTRPRSASYHRATMFRILVAAILLCLFWQPIRPLRIVTADALHTAAYLVSR